MSTKKKRGFTLVELLVVISVIGLLSSIVLVSFNEASDKAKIPICRRCGSIIKHSIGDQLVGEWTFDNDTVTEIIDASGFGNDGLYQGGLSLSDHVDGIMGQALEFDGSNDYVDINKDIFNSQNFTVTLWAKRSDTSANCLYRIEKPGGSGERIVVVLGAGSMNYYRNNGAYIGTGSIIGNVDVWSHYAFVESTTGCKIYLNGEEVGSSNTPMGINMGHFREIGRDYPFNGYIDNFRIYDKILTSSQIQKYYTEGLEKHQNLAQK